MFEGLSKQGNPTLLNKIYTELYIIEGESVGVCDVHEVRQIEMTSSKAARLETAIKCNNIFEASAGQDTFIGTILMV